MNVPGVTFECWSCWQPTAEHPQCDVSFVPPLMRRRLTALERAMVAVAQKVWPDPAPPEGLPVIFASRWGEIGTTFKLMRQLYEESEMSPAGFSTSVHNAAPGILSLLMHNTAAYTAIAAREHSLSAGFLEALAHRTRVLFVYTEEATPAFYRPAFGPPQEACAVAVRLNATHWHWNGSAPLAQACTFADFVAQLKEQACTCV